MVACRSPKSRGACSNQAIPVRLCLSLILASFNLQVMGLEPIQRIVMVA